MCKHILKVIQLKNKEYARLSGETAAREARERFEENSKNEADGGTNISHEKEVDDEIEETGFSSYNDMIIF